MKLGLKRHVFEKLHFDFQRVVARQLLENHILRPHYKPIGSELWVWSPVSFTGPPGDSHAGSSLRSIAFYHPQELGLKRDLSYHSEGKEEQEIKGKER